MKTQLIELGGGERNEVIKCVEDMQYVVTASKNFSDEEYNLNFVFETKDVNASVFGLFNLGKDDVLKLNLRVDHKVRGTSCHADVRAVLLENAFSQFLGKIVVDKCAVKTRSELNNKTLVVGNNTKSISSPVLNINTDDVICSHGSTTGRISDEEIYYLQSRGLSEKQSIDVVKQGFFEDLLREVIDEKIRNEVLIRLEGLL